jgi:hypothetical protein
MKTKTPIPSWPALELSAPFPLSPTNEAALKKYQGDVGQFEQAAAVLFSDREQLLAEANELPLNELRKRGEELTTRKHTLSDSFKKIHWTKFELKQALLPDYVAGVEDARERLAEVIAIESEMFAEMGIDGPGLAGDAISPQAGEIQLRTLIETQLPAIAAKCHLQRSLDALKSLKATLDNAPGVKAVAINLPATNNSEAAQIAGVL